jgi:excisionase family DNA binding protein
MEKNILNINDLAQYTGWSKSFIYKKTSDGTLKFSKPLGKTIFFSKEWVDTFLLSKTTSTTKELESKAATFITLKKGGVKC